MQAIHALSQGLATIYFRALAAAPVLSTTCQGCDSLLTPCRPSMPSHKGCDVFAKTKAATPSLQCPRKGQTLFLYHAGHPCPLTKAALSSQKLHRPRIGLHSPHKGCITSAAVLSKGPLSHPTPCRPSMPSQKLVTTTISSGKYCSPCCASP